MITFYNRLFRCFYYLSTIIYYLLTIRDKSLNEIYRNDVIYSNFYFANDVKLI